MEKGIAIVVDFSNGFHQRLEQWLLESHPDIFWDIDFHEGGSITVSPEEIQFSGDNGLFILEPVHLVEV